MRNRTRCGRRRAVVAIVVTATVVAVGAYLANPGTRWAATMGGDSGGKAKAELVNTGAQWNMTVESMGTLDQAQAALDQAQAMLKLARAESQEVRQ